MTQEPRTRNLPRPIFSCRAAERLLRVFAAASAFACAPAAAIDWNAAGRQIAAQALSDPGAFMAEFQQDLEATTPLPTGQPAALQAGLAPSLFPAGMANLSVKRRLCPESYLFENSPQIEAFAGGWIMPLPQMTASWRKDDMDSAFFGGYYAGLMGASSMSPRVRMFYGLKYSRLRARLELKKQRSIFGVPVSSFDSDFADGFFIVGLEQIDSSEHRWSMQLNFGVATNTVAAKISWYGEHWEAGANIYPEGAIPIHPVVNYHVAF
ncbi:MAG: hypothetical protein WC421_05160 [Elusimicrobiales bacterium]